MSGSRCVTVPLCVSFTTATALFCTSFPGSRWMLTTYCRLPYIHISTVHDFHGWRDPPRGGGVLSEKLGRGVRPASQNPYPIYDQNLRFSLPYLWPDQTFDTLFMTWLLDHWGKGFCCWLYLACVAGVKRGRGRQSADGRRRAWWRSSFF